MSYLIMAGQAAGALIAIFSLLGMFIKYVVVKPIKAYIEQMTYQIQPTSNGGKSLPDLINSVEEVKTMLNKHIKEHDTPVK